MNVTRVERYDELLVGDSEASMVILPTTESPTVDFTVSSMVGNLYIVPLLDARIRILIRVAREAMTYPVLSIAVPTTSANTRDNMWTLGYHVDGSQMMTYNFPLDIKTQRKLQPDDSIVCRVVSGVAASCRIGFAINTFIKT